MSMYTRFHGSILNNEVIFYFNGTKEKNRISKVNNIAALGAMKFKQKDNPPQLQYQ